MLAGHAEFSDMDMDGDLDIPFTSTYGDSLHWYENVNGSDEFVLHDLDFHVVTPQKLILEDMNQDGVKDIVTYTTNDKIHIFENRGLSKNRITGQVSFDILENQCESGHEFIEDILVTTEGENNSNSTLSFKDEFYQLTADAGLYKTSVINNSPGIISVSPSEEFSNFLNVGTIDTVHFCLSPLAEVNDIGITIIPITDARPGFELVYQVIIENTGTKKASGTFDVVYNDAALTFLEANPSVLGQQSNSLQFGFSELRPFNKIIYHLSFKIETIPAVSLGQNLETVGVINDFGDDIELSNNQFRLVQEIIGSYDPNDIRVLEGKQVHIDNSEEYLHYIIRFQNTGTASAINVRVENSLDQYLNWRSFELLSTSHDVEVRVTDSVDLAFYFDNINLPDSLSNPINSQGSVSYTHLTLPTTPYV